MNVESAVQNSCALFIHGHGSSSETWRDILPRLSPYGRCYAINLRGHGGLHIGEESTYDLEHLSQDVWDFCNEKKLEKLAIIAHSMGCRIAVMMAHQHPERVGRLVLVDMEMEPRPIQVLDERTLENRRSFKEAYHSLDELKLALLGCGYSNESIKEMLSRGKILKKSDSVEYFTLQHPYTEYLAKNFISASLLAKQAFAELPQTLPVTLLLAENESSVTSEGKSWMQSVHPNLRVKTIPGSDHRVHKTAREAFLKEVARVVEETSHYGVR